MIDDAAATHALGALYHAAPAAAKRAKATLRYALQRQDDGWLARVPVRPAFGPAELADAWSFVEWRATEDVLAAERKRPCLHAAGVRLGSRNVLLIGAAGAGKSTLAAHLLAAGNAIWGDDLVCFAPDAGTFSAFPRSLKLDAKTLQELSLVVSSKLESSPGTLLAPPVSYVSPAAFRADWQAAEGSIDCVVLLSSEGHHGPPQVERVSEGAAAVLASQSIIAGHWPGTEQTALMVRVLEALRDATAWRASGAGAALVARAIEGAVAHA